MKFVSLGVAMEFDRLFFLIVSKATNTDCIYQMALLIYMNKQGLGNNN